MKFFVLGAGYVHIDCLFVGILSHRDRLQFLLLKVTQIQLDEAKFEIEASDSGIRFFGKKVLFRSWHHVNCVRILTR